MPANLFRGRKTIAGGKEESEGHVESDSDNEENGEKFCLSHPELEPGLSLDVGDPEEGDEAGPDGGADDIHASQEVEDVAKVFAEYYAQRHRTVDGDDLDEDDESE